MFGAFTRSFTLPKTVDSDRISASYKDGVLELTLPKVAQAKPRKIKIKIRPGADIEYIGAVRQALGDDAPLMADANSAYTLRLADHLKADSPHEVHRLNTEMGANAERVAREQSS